MKDERKKRGRKGAKKKRALRRRRRMALVAGLLAAVLLAMAVNAVPGLAGYAWGAAALAAAVEAILLALRRGVPAGLYVLIGALCVALVALGAATRDLVFADKGIVPRESLVTELTVTDRWPDHIERYTGLETLDLRNSTVTDFSPVLRMRSLRALDARGNAAFDEATYAEISAALPECAIDWSMSLAGRYYDSGTTEVDLSGTGLDADEITELQAEHPDIDFTYTVPLMGKEIDPAATAIDLRGAETVDPDAILAALSLLPNAKRVDLRDAPVTLDVAEALMNGRPDVDFNFTFAIPGGSMDSDAETVTLPGGTYDDLRTAMGFIPYMPRLQYLDARAIVMNASEQEALRSDPASGKVLYNFTVYGQQVNLLTTALNLDNVQIGGRDTAEQVFAALPNLRTVSMVGCGLTQEDMIALCEAHPDIHFIWVVQFGKYQLRTDATAFNITSEYWAIISGTGHQNKLMILGGWAAANLMARAKGPAADGKALNDMAFGSYCKKIPEPRTPFDWISRDQAAVDKYIDDPYCGFVCKVGLYRDMMGAVRFITDQKNIDKMNKEAPVYFMSGDADPVGDYGVGVEKAYQAFCRAGLKDVTIRLYPGGRHEMLNETNRETVKKDILDWINEKLEKIS